MMAGAMYAMPVLLDVTKGPEGIQGNGTVVSVRPRAMTTATCVRRVHHSAISTSRPSTTILAAREPS